VNQWGGDNSIEQVCGKSDSGKTKEGTQCSEGIRGLRGRPINAGKGGGCDSSIPEKKGPSGKILQEAFLGRKREGEVKKNPGQGARTSLDVAGWRNVITNRGRERGRIRRRVPVGREQHERGREGKGGPWGLGVFFCT